MNPPDPASGRSGRREEGPTSPGPPGSTVFSLEGRPAPGLYFAAWLLSSGGLALLFIGLLTGSDIGRALLILGGMAALGIGLAAGAGYQVVARRSRRAWRYRGPAPLLLFGIVICLSTLVSIIPLAGGLLRADAPWGFLLGLVLVAGAYLLVVWLFVVRSRALGPRRMGWPTGAKGRPAQILRDIGIGAGVMLPVTFAILVLGALVGGLLGIEAPSVLPTPTGSGEALAVAFGAALVAPIGEEIFFRGFALSAWRADLGERAALVRSAVFFALVHIVNITTDDFARGAAQALLQFSIIVPLGLVLGVLFLRRGLMAAIAAHVTYNSLLLVLLLLASRAQAVGQA